MASLDEPVFDPYFVVFFVFVASVLLAPILLGEALALYGAARGPRYRRWRPWLSLVPLLAGLVNFALADIRWTLLHRPIYSYQSLTFETYEALAVPSVVSLLVAYGLALAGLVALAVLRRQAEAAIDTASR